MISEQLKKHNFQVMDTSLSVDPSGRGENFVTEDFIPTQE
ncbi:hypothetical protein CP061683_0832, partial [Chlamydia psittaci 06-1683]